MPQIWLRMAAFFALIKMVKCLQCLKRAKAGYTPAKRNKY